MVQAVEFGIKSAWVRVECPWVRGQGPVRARTVDESHIHQCEVGRVSYGPDSHCRGRRLPWCRIRISGLGIGVEDLGLRAPGSSNTDQ